MGFNRVARSIGVYRYNLVCIFSQNCPIGTWVVQVYAVDGDEGPNGEVRYGFVMSEVVRKDWLKFNIDPVGGNITTAKNIDREEQEIYLVRVLYLNI